MDYYANKTSRVGDRNINHKHRFPTLSFTGTGSLHLLSQAQVPYTFFPFAATGGGAGAC